jgi:hypothetical protein
VPSASLFRSAAALGAEARRHPPSSPLYKARASVESTEAPPPSLNLRRRVIALVGFVSKCRCHFPSFVSSAARPPLAKTVVPHRALSLWSLGTLPHHRWPQGGVITVGNPSCRLCSATSTVLRPLGETHHPSPLSAHAPWSPLVCAGHLLPPRPPVSRHQSCYRVGQARRAGLGWLGHCGREQQAASAV